MRSSTWRRLSLYFGMLVAAMLVACSSADTGGSLPVSVSGYVALAERINGAKVDIYAAPKRAGDAPLASATTDRTGRFNAGLPSGKDFTVEVSQITLSDGTTVPGMLRADVRNYDQTLVDINPATTLVSALMAKRPDLPPEQAAALVRHFLGLPDYKNLPGLMTTTADFSHAKFLMEALDAKGLDTFTASLVQEMQSSPSAVHSFAQQLLQAGTGITGLINPEALATKLADTVLSRTIGLGVDAALSWLGLGGNGNDAAILNRLQAIDDKLADLKNQLQNINSNVLQADWNSRRESLTTYTDSLKFVYDLYRELAPYTRAQIAANNTLRIKQDQMYNKICSDLQTNPWRIHDEMVGRDGKTPLISLYSRVVAAKRRFYTADSEAEYKEVMQNLEYAQSAMYEVFTRYLMAGRASTCSADFNSPRIEVDNSDPDVVNLAKAYKEKIAAHVYPHTLPPDVTIDMQQGQMMYTPKAGWPVKKIGVTPWLAAVHPSLPWDPNSTPIGYGGTKGLDYAVGGWVTIPTYDKTDLGTAWNFAALVMNSAQSPMAAEPAFLRQGWKLPTNDMFYSVFYDGIDTAIARGFPSYNKDALAWLAYDYEKDGHPWGCMEMYPTNVCRVGEQFNVHTRQWGPVYNAQWTAAVIPFRALSATESADGYYYFKP